MIPYGYEFKRLASQLRLKSTYGFFLEGLEAAPVYYFADQAAFDSDELEALGRLIMAEDLKLPHPEVIFEVKDRHPERESLLVYVRQFEGRVEAALFSRWKKRLRWTDCLAHAVFAKPGWADVSVHPGIKQDQAKLYMEAVSGMVWRSLSILAFAGDDKPRKVMPALRRPYAKAGVRGWTWHQITIDLARARAKTQDLSGTHASPRWHIRRGHWRQLADGRRVFVRQCQVGDPAQGGVVKDYIVKGSAA
jgi:hypothetical protein